MDTLLLPPPLHLSTDAAPPRPARTSTRSGTPFISYWLNFQPGVLSAEASSSTRTPAALRAPSSRATAAVTASPSASFLMMGTMTTWAGG